MKVTKHSSQKMGRGTRGKTAVSFSQGVALVSVLLLFLGATWLAFTQSPRINALQPPTLTERLFDPWESNVIKRMPIVIGNLNDLFVLPDSQLVWVVGDGGLILHSKDGGITWVQQVYPTGSSAKKRAAKPLSLVEPPSLFSKAMAGEDTKAQYSSVDDSNQDQMQKGFDKSSPDTTQTYKESSALDTSASDTSTQSAFAEPERIIPDGQLADLNLVYFADAKSGVALSETGIVLGTTDGGATWQFEDVAGLESKARELTAYSEKLLESMGGNLWQDVKPRISQMPNLEGREALVLVGAKGVIYKFINTDREWVEQEKYTDSNLNAIEILGDKSWLLVGDDGLIARSNDDGETWHPLTRGIFSWLDVAPLSEEELLAEDKNTDGVSYQKFPAPWYWLVCCLIIAYGVYFFTRTVDPLPPEESIADLLASDRPLRPGDPDPLGYNSIACGLSRFMRNPSTEPPLTLAITGAWGSGKSSLMNLLYYDLKKFGFTPVWFNAWHHQKGEQLLASLYANIRSQAVPGLFSFSQMIPVGLMFRINLLFRRGVKHWLMTVVLIGVFAASATYLFTHSQSSSVSVNKITEALVTPGFSWETLLVALFGNVAPLMALLQTLRAFGLNPLSLMTAQHDRQAQGRVDPSARQQFAREFNEVAKSLSLGRMVIFIDDLDRCSKENVVDILEAINFLSVSGDCYIVLGMDEAWVKICIDEHFKEMSKDKLDFSEQYLEKMINIKVPVPQLSEADTSKLLAWELPDTNPGDASFVVQIWRGVKGALYPYRYFLLMLCVVMMGVCFGFLIDLLFRVEAKPPPPQQTIATWNNIKINQLSMVGGNPDFTLSVQENTASTSSGSTAGSTAPAWELSLNATEDDLKKGIVIGKLGDAKASASLILKGRMPAKEAASTREKTDNNISQSHDTTFRIGEQDNSWTDYWLPLLAGILLAVGVAAYSMKMPVRRPKDSVEFKKALEIWKPWILLNRQTPRAIKRYLNRVRYMAMRYRADPEAQSLGLGEALLRLFRKGDVVEKQVQGPDAQLEAKLVALSAIQAVDTPWALNVFDIGNIHYEDLHELVKNKFGEQAGSSDKAMKLVQQLWESIGKHREKFGDTIVTDSDKKMEFEKMLADMHVK